MALHRASAAVVSLKTRRDIIISKPGQIEPVLERSHGSVMFEGPPIPNSFQRWNLVIASAFVRFERITRVGADARFHEIKPLPVAFRWIEPVHGNELVIGVQRWRVACSAARAFEDCLSPGSGRVEGVGICLASYRMQIKEKC